MTETQLEHLQSLVHRSDLNLAISPESPGGVLLKGRFFDDIIFPGASLIKASHFACRSVQVIGDVQLIPSDDDRRRQGRRLRIQDIAAIQRILRVPDARQRACLVVNLFCRRLGLGAALTLDPAIVARMVFTDPQQVVGAYRSYEKSLTGLVNSGRLGRSDVLAWQRRLDDPTVGQNAQMSNLQAIQP